MNFHNNNNNNELSHDCILSRKSSPQKYESSFANKDVKHLKQLPNIFKWQYISNLFSSSLLSSLDKLGLSLILCENFQGKICVEYWNKQDT